MALPQHLQLRIVSADRSLVNEQVDEVEIPGADGYFGGLPGHTPLLALLGAGELWYRQGPGENNKHYLAIAFGFAEVQPDAVTILAQIAEKPDDIDLVPADGDRRERRPDDHPRAGPGAAPRGRRADRGRVGDRHLRRPGERARPADRRVGTRLAIRQAR